jgi:hypothetical protein
LRGPEGKTVTVQVDERVRNLPQVKKGDEVRVAYYESVVFQVRQPGEVSKGSTTTGGLETARPGERPAARQVEQLTIVTTVQAIDKESGTITLKGPEGEIETFTARNPANLDKVKVGDLLEITYTEGIAISVEKPTR